MPIKTHAHGCEVIIDNDGIVQARNGVEVIGNSEHFPNEWITLSNAVTSPQLHCLAEKTTPEGLIRTIKANVQQI